mmetsp:Transcript_94881/g.263597  ORF Transcript_94881/g.263597 Transcript_94881/m.263597 type:complete len:218 (+) Transcript_94881:156-809(+)
MRAGLLLRSFAHARTHWARKLYTARARHTENRPGHRPRSSKARRRPRPWRRRAIDELRRPGSLRLGSGPRRAPPCGDRASPAGAASAPRGRRGGRSCRPGRCCSAPRARRRKACSCRRRGRRSLGSEAPPRPKAEAAGARRRARTTSSRQASTAPARRLVLRQAARRAARYRAKATARPRRCRTSPRSRSGPRARRGRCAAPRGGAARSQAATAAPR